jgi:GntR family transcriptional regulator, transcriptional repressor for pyruvate dehydrogenase complex
MEPIKKIRLSERVIEALKQIIEEEQFAPGDKFYSENELTKKLQVSRSSIREAVRILEATGYVKVQHGKGIFISGDMAEEMEAFTSWLSSNEKAIFEHFEVRLIIDPKAASYAAKNADAQDIAKMKEVCADFTAKAKSGNIAGLIKCDEQFHMLLAKSTKNRTLHFCMKTMANSLPEGWITSLHIPGRVEKTVPEHHRILEAIGSGDPVEAEQAMRDHLNNALKDIEESIK